MKLLIDFGNSRCKWARCEEGALQSVDAIEYARQTTQQRVEGVMQAIHIDDIKQVHAVSVLGAEFEESFANQLASLAGITVKFHHSQKNNYGVTLSYSNVHTYGDDRYAALIAAHHQVGGNKIVVDCGTATTIDMIDSQGHHEGGLIMPGARLMVESLVNKASGVFSNETKQPVNLLCNNTQDAVYSGCVSQLQYGVQGIINKLTDGKQCVVILTGGESSLLDLTTIADTECIQRPHLVLEGLRVMQE